MTPTNDCNNSAPKSWIESANQSDCPFPIQNLPFGVFTSKDKPSKRVGVAIGDQVLDLSVLEKVGLLPVPSGTFDKPDINIFMALGSEIWTQALSAIRALLVEGPGQLQNDAGLKRRALDPLLDVTLHLPIRVGEYTDFYASREHATNVGSMFRDPDNALMPNWLHMPIAYNGRAMRTGDLLGSGTISGPDKNAYGSLLELTWNGQNSITLNGGDERTFIEDGDTLSMTGWCQGDGYRIGFGEAVGRVLPALKITERTRHRTRRQSRMVSTLGHGWFRRV